MRAALCLGVFFFVLSAPARAGGESDFPPVSELLAPVVELPIPREELRDALASPPDLDWFHGELLSHDPLRRRDAVLAFGYPGNFAAIPHVSAVLLRLDEEPPVRVAAAEALGRIGDRRAASFLSQALNDFDERVRFAAALAMGRIDADANVAHLEKTLRKDPSWWVRYAAASAMGGTRKAFTAGWLERAVCEDASWQVRFQAVWALGELGTQRAATALGKALRDPETTVRCAAALALARIRGPRTAFILGRALRYEEDGGVRSILAMALRKAGG
jgi:HEAT repeat protein